MDKPSFQLTQGDAVAWLRTLPASSVDLLITDPPYESLEKHRAIGTTTRLKHSKASSNDWFSIFPNARFPELFAEVYRVLRKDSHFYLFCDPETMFVAKPLAEAAGFKFWKPVIWDKCLGPDTLVWTEAGTKRIADIEVGDRVAVPEGGTTRVKATRRTRSPSLRLTLSDGTDLIASRDHRFMKSDGELVEAIGLRTGHRLCTRPVRLPRTAQMCLEPASGSAASTGKTELERLSLELVARAVRLEPATVTAIEDVGMQDLVDISVEHADELFLLANGVVTHNCTIGMGYHYRARYECVLFFEKGKRKLNDLGVADIIEHKRINGGYPAEKPPEVSEVLIEQSSEPGELVVDPFSGSGSVGVASVRNGRDFRGNDLCQEAIDIARSRLIADGAVEGVRERRAEAAPQLGLYAVTGHNYRDLIASYIHENYAAYGLVVYVEISLGKTVIGKDRYIDVFVVRPDDRKAIAIECKYQDSLGTVDEKIPYALQDLEALWVPGCLAYAGKGWSRGVLHTLEGSRLAAYCLPDKDSLARGKHTRELDHTLAAIFGLWDVVLPANKRFKPKA